jgi:hypothetical protein
MSKEKAKIRHYSNGTVIKISNRKISVTESKDGNIILQFKHADKTEDPSKPACEHHCHRGKVRQTTVKVSEVGMEALAIAIIEYMKIKAKAKVKPFYSGKFIIQNFDKNNDFVGYLSAYTQSGALQFAPQLIQAIEFDSEEEANQWIAKYGNNKIYTIVKI